MRLVAKQHQFAVMFAKLILFADLRGYKMSIGDVYSAPGIGIHRKGSLHELKLAGDLNLFTEDYVYLVKTEDHKELGEYWESIGGSWGGHFDDGNHYSLEHEGRR